MLQYLIPILVPRLACALILEGKFEDLLALFGICCSTLVSMSRGSTLRTMFNPEGCPISIAVYKANKGICRQGVYKSNGWTTVIACYTYGSRTEFPLSTNCGPERSVLLVFLTIAVGGVPILENPNSTLLNCHPRFQHLVALLKEKGWSTLLCYSACFCFMQDPD